MYFRVKRSGAYPYLQVVQSYRDGQQVRQHVIATLGRLDVLQATGQMDRLIRSGVRFCEKVVVIDAHASGKTEAVKMRQIGPDLVFGRLWEQSGIQGVLRQMLAEWRYEFEVERAIYLTTLHRLFTSGSDRATEHWREDYLIAGTEELSLHHLYRAIAFLGEPLSDGPTALGSPRCVKDAIEEALFEPRDLASRHFIPCCGTATANNRWCGG